MAFEIPAPKNHHCLGPGLSLQKRVELLHMRLARTAYHLHCDGVSLSNRLRKVGASRTAQHARRPADSSCGGALPCSDLPWKAPGSSKRMQAWPGLHKEGTCMRMAVPEHCMRGAAAPCGKNSKYLSKSDVSILDGATLRQGIVASSSSSSSSNFGSRSGSSLGRDILCRSYMAGGGGLASGMASSITTAGAQVAAAVSMAEVGGVAAAVNDSAGGFTPGMAQRNTDVFIVNSLASDGMLCCDTGTAGTNNNGSNPTVARAANGTAAAASSTGKVTGAPAVAASANGMAAAASTGQVTGAPVAADSPAAGAGASAAAGPLLLAANVYISEGRAAPVLERLEVRHLGARLF